MNEWEEYLNGFQKRIMGEGGMRHFLDEMKSVVMQRHEAYMQGGADYMEAGIMARADFRKMQPGTDEASIQMCDELADYWLFLEMEEGENDEE